MGAISNHPPRYPHISRFLDAFLDHRHRGDGTESTIRFDEDRRRSFGDHLNIRFGIHQSLLDELQVDPQQCETMGIDAPAVRPQQNLRLQRCIHLFEAHGTEAGRNEFFQPIRVDKSIYHSSRFTIVGGPFMRKAHATPSARESGTKRSDE